MSEDTTSNRFVRGRCPICDVTSPIVDQATDVHRTGISEWWVTHRLSHLPAPIIESVTPVRTAGVYGVGGTSL